MIYRKHNGTLEPLSYQPSGGGSYSWDSVFPVGVTYIQYTTDDNPNNLFAGTTWTDITANFDESFFRIEGGNASGFGCGRQGQGTSYTCNLSLGFTTSVSHNHMNSTIKWARDSTSASLFLCNGVTPTYIGVQNSNIYCPGKTITWGYGFSSCTCNCMLNAYGYCYYKIQSTRVAEPGTGVSASVSFTGSFDSETRPTNRAIKIWERTA